MSNYVTLMGSEDVFRAWSNMRQAASEMQSAASEMQSAANSMSYANEMQERFMTDWLDRLEGILAADLNARMAAAQEILTPAKEGE